MAQDPLRDLTTPLGERVSESEGRVSTPGVGPYSSPGCRTIFVTGIHPGNDRGCGSGTGAVTHRGSPRTVSYTEDPVSAVRETLVSLSIILEVTPEEDGKGLDGISRSLINLRSSSKSQTQRGCLGRGAPSTVPTTGQVERFYVSWYREWCELRLPQ